MDGIGRARTEREKTPPASDRVHPRRKNRRGKPGGSPRWVFSSAVLSHLELRRRLLEAMHLEPAILNVGASDTANRWVYPAGTSPAARRQGSISSALRLVRPPPNAYP